MLWDTAPSENWDPAQRVVPTTTQIVCDFGCGGASREIARISQIASARWTVALSQSSMAATPRKTRAVPGIPARTSKWHQYCANISRSRQHMRDANVSRRAEGDAYLQSTAPCLISMSADAELALLPAVTGGAGRARRRTTRATGAAGPPIEGNISRRTPINAMITRS
jgi:hypothetical protein